MAFEHKHQRVIPFSQFLVRQIRYFLFAASLIVFSVTGGVAGYMFFGDLCMIDAFHMACMILTGMGPVAEMVTDAAKLFSALYALYSGVAFLSIVAVTFAPIIHRLLHRLQVETGDEGKDYK